MYCKAIACVIALTTVLDLSVDSMIVQRPSNTTAIVSESTFFNCSTSVRPVNKRSVSWFHYPLDREGDRQYVYNGGIIMTKYMNRFAIDIDLSSGAFNLLALRLEPKDAGRYECKDDIQEGIGASAELTVLDSDLVCESDLNQSGIVGPTQCDNVITPDELQLSCSVTYNGKNAPKMGWINNEGLSILNKTDCTTKENRVTCNTTIPANRQQDRSVYYCESITQKHRCSLEINNVLDAFANTAKEEFHTGDEVTCVANASRQLPCSYKWFDNSLTEVSSHPTFKPTDPGLYRCQAECEIRGDSCTFTVMLINVSTVSDPRTNVRYYWLCLLIPGVGLIFVMLFKRNWSSRCWCNRPKKKRNLPNDINVEHQFLMRPHVDAENSMQQDEQRTVSSFNSPSNQLEDAANMTANAKNGEEIQDQTNLNETNDDSNAKELIAEGNTAETIAETIADKTRIDEERIVEAIVEETREERDAKNGNEIIKRCRDFLEERMDPDSGLLDTLANETLSWREFLEVKDKSPFCKRNSLLLDYILEKHQYNGLLSALQENEQLHIVNYLNANAERRPEYGEEWPLTANEIKILGANQKSLINLLKLSVLLGRLHSSKVINLRQLLSISSNPSSCSKNEAILDILRRRSLRDYHQTIRCLRESKQSAIADVLEKGGVIAEVHANLDEPSENVDEVEDEISTSFANTLDGKSIAESIKILERAQLKVIAAQKGGCIVLYIWCVTEKELLRLFDSQTSGRLKDDAEQLFNQLLAHSKQVAVKNITMIDEDCERMKAYFGVIAEVHANLDEPSENVDEVEDEISTSFANTLNGKSIAESIKILEQVAVKNITMIDEDCERMKAYFGDHDAQFGITDGFPAVQVIPYTAMRGLMMTP